MSFNRHDYVHLFDLGRELLGYGCAVSRRKEIGVELMDLAEQVVGQLRTLPRAERARRDKHRLSTVPAQAAGERDACPE